MINKPPPHNRDYDRDPNINTRKGFINHRSTLLRGQVQKSHATDIANSESLENVSFFESSPKP